LFLGLPIVVLSIAVFESVWFRRTEREHRAVAIDWLLAGVSCRVGLRNGPRYCHWYYGPHVGLRRNITTRWTGAEEQR
jgi:hypothetical protein